MDGRTIASTCIMAPFLLGLAGFALWLAYGAVEDSPGALWPRGTRWIPGAVLALGRWVHHTAVRIWYPERRWELKSRQTELLERLDRQWKGALDWQADTVPVWCPWPNGKGGDWKAQRFIKGEPWDC